MKTEYQPQSIEKKWQDSWQAKGLYTARDSSKPGQRERYILVEFPYPSGEGLHVGHCLSYIAQDVVSRYYRLKGENVLFPMGWDAFGLPAENFAIKHKIHPRQAVEKNIANFKRQIQSLGISFDWSREINTTDPAYYKWTQWIFLQLFKASLAEKRLTKINWCPKDKIGLAFEEVVDGKCERCGSEVEQREINQWILKITKYADRLIDDLETVDYLPHIKQQQINWIGRSEGLEIDFQTSEGDALRVFTTRPDTIFGATFLVIAPEHPLVESYKSKVENSKEVEKYVTEARKLTDRERQEKKEKTGVALRGITAINPMTKQAMPIFVADYVMMSYGTGAIMAVPAHDERDWEFARKYQLPIEQVIAPHFTDPATTPREGKKTVRRKNVHCIVRRASDGKVLLLDWKVNLTPQRPRLYSFIIGGVDEGEDLETAAKREIFEETGYQDVTFVKKLPLEIHSEYYAHHKDENRYAEISIAVFDLKSETQMSTTEEEKAKHDIMWVDEADVIKKLNIADGPFIWQQYLTGGQSFAESGIMINSGDYNNLSNEVAGEKICDALIDRGVAQRKINYKLRDWIFSRQHYWGEPIPIIICDACGYVPLEEKDLPLELPEVDHYEPTETGESPLAAISDWVNVTCPKCGKPAKRETDTMPNWAGSSWYFLRYTDPHNDTVLADKKKLDYWLPVDLYNGGMEHTTLHLLYSRFWHKFLYDQGLVPTVEPYARRVSHGMILGPDNQKMSKSRGNVINPDSIVEKYGADTLRLYEMFMGEYDGVKVWSEDSLRGSYRFLTGIWNYYQALIHGGPVILTDDPNYFNPAISPIYNRTIKKVTDDIERRSFNTVVSSLMILWNNMTEPEISREIAEGFLILLAPLAPHITEELWQQLGHKDSIHQQSWPKANEKLLASQKVVIAIQINGKLRAQIEIDPNVKENKVKEMVLALPAVQKQLAGAEPKKFIYVPGKIVSIVV